MDGDLPQTTDMMTGIPDISVILVITLHFANDLPADIINVVSSSNSSMATTFNLQFCDIQLLQAEKCPTFDSTRAPDIPILLLFNESIELYVAFMHID